MSADSPGRNPEFENEGSKMHPKLYTLGGATLGLTLGLSVSRGSGILLLLILGTALGWLLSLVASDET